MRLWKTLDSASLADELAAVEQSVLLFGAPGVGKSTLAASLADELVRKGRRVVCISADPGSPAFGVPGALCLGVRHKGDWETVAVEGLCTLNAGRFRLPLIDALRRLITRAPPGTLLIDAPGVVRGVAGAELLLAIAEAVAVRAVVAITRDPDRVPLAAELQATGAETWVVPAASQARRPGKRRRARKRTELWDRYLEGAGERRLSLDGLRLIGTPPPVDLPEAWSGRQVALLDPDRRTFCLGDVVNLDQGQLVLRTPALPDTEAGSCLLVLVRDARRVADGLLQTATPASPGIAWYTPPPDLLASPAPPGSGGPRPVLRAGSATVTLLNGIFGDPLLHLRLRQEKRSLLFDLGEAGRLPARIAHQVTDVFISHAHFDHIAGFLWLLRSRIGVGEICRIHGPPGLARHIQGLIDGILWDRIGDRGPRFEVTELHGGRLVRYRIQAGSKTPTPLPERDARNGVVLDEAGFRVRAVTLDHHTPVLAYAFEPAHTRNIKKDRLLETGFPPGPWLGELKRRIAGDDLDALIELPDGARERTRRLADRLVLVKPGRKVVYATDLADSADNRQRLTDLARGAHTLFCEAVFVEADAAQAVRTGHLTARACGEIAAAAQVQRLVPFHFSRRYEKDPWRVYDEVRAACSRVVAPPPEAALTP